MNNVRRHLSSWLRETQSKASAASDNFWNDEEGKQAYQGEEYGVIRARGPAPVYTVYPRKILGDKPRTFAVGDKRRKLGFYDVKALFRPRDGSDARADAIKDFPKVDLRSASGKIDFVWTTHDGVQLVSVPAATYANDVLTIVTSYDANTIRDVVRARRVPLENYFRYEAAVPTGKGLVPPPPAAAATAPAPASDEPARWFERQNDLPSVFMDSSGAGNQFAPAPGLVYEDENKKSRLVLTNGDERILHKKDLVWGNKSHTPLHPGPPAWQRASVASVEHVLRQKGVEDVAKRRFAARRIYGLYTLHASAELMGFGECVPKVVEKLQAQNVGS
jgi:hypothetical protein